MVKSPRLNSLLASTAAVLVLAVSSHAGVAQQANTPAEASIPMPDTTLPPPLTLKDIEKPARRRRRAHACHTLILGVGLKSCRKSGVHQLAVQISHTTQLFGLDYWEKRNSLRTIS